MHVKCTVICMASITITISEQAYKLLKAAKREDESFSDVIIRVFPRGDPNRVLAYIETHQPLDAETAETIRKTSEEVRQNFRANVPEQ